jgi:hypothetical protein
MPDFARPVAEVDFFDRHWLDTAISGHRRHSEVQDGNRLAPVCLPVRGGGIVPGNRVWRSDALVIAALILIPLATGLDAAPPQSVTLTDSEAYQIYAALVPGVWARVVPRPWAAVPTDTVLIQEETGLTRPVDVCVSAIAGDDLEWGAVASDFEQQNRNP